MSSFSDVKLFVYEPGGVDREAFPLTVGLPFAPGALLPEAPLTVTDSADKDLPLQTRIMEKHTDGSVRWLLLDFQADLPNLRESVFTLAQGEKQPSNSKNKLIQMEEQNGLLLIDNGVLQLRIDKSRCQPLTEVKYRWRLVSSGGADICVAATDGKAYSAHHDADAKFEIEEFGPLRVGLRWEGTQRDSAGNGSFDFLVRMWVYAEKPFVRMDYTFFNRLDPEDTRVSSIVARLPIDVGAEPSYQVSDLTRVVTGFGTDEPVRLEQLQIGRYQILNANGELLKETRVNARGWIDVSGPELGVMIVCKNFWQNFPKAIEAKPDGLEYYMVPELPEGYSIQRGMAKTHTFFYRFHDGQADPTDRAEMAHNLQRWPMPVAEARHYLESGELFDYFGYYPKQYPRLETAFLKLLALDDPDHTRKNPAHGRCYGLKHYGDMVLRSPNDGEDIDHTDTMFHNNEYDTAHVLAMMFLHNREISNVWVGEAHALHMMDIDTCHHTVSVPKDFVGVREIEIFNGLQHCHSNQHTSRFASHSHTFAEGLIDYYHLTGDRRALETARGYAHSLAFLTNNYDDFKWGVGRSSGWSLLVLGSVYRVEPDEDIRKAAEAMIYKIIAKQDPSGFFYDSKICAKAFTDREIHLCLRGLIRWHQVTGNEKIDKLLRQAMPIILKKAFSETGVPIYGSWPEKHAPTTHVQGYANLESLAYAYRLTGNRQYIDAGVGRLCQLIPWIEDPNRDEHYGNLWYRIMRGPFPFLQAAHELTILEKVPGAGSWLYP